MQTFLTSRDFEQNARCLDDQRLISQRFEAKLVYDLLEDPKYRNHPLILLWKRNPRLLCTYALSICSEFNARGFQDKLHYEDFFTQELTHYPLEPDPIWWNDERVFSSHRASLLNKNYVFYKRYGWNELPNLHYFWPAHEMKERYEALKKAINEANYAYYVCDAPTISDAAYDKLMKELAELEDQDASLISISSPTQRVGGNVGKEFKAVDHLTPMYSLDNAFSSEELEKWVNGIASETGNDNHRWCVEWKYDGLSLSVIYEDGMFVRAVTRGSGSVGEDVTEQARTIKNLPLELEGDFPGTLEVRGEVCIPKSQLAKINKARVANGDKPYANCRNLAAGSLRALDPKVTASRGLIFFAWGLGVHSLDITSQDRVLSMLESLDFSVGDYESTTGFEHVLARILELEKLRPNLKYDVDGVVIKLNNVDTQSLLGYKSRSPRFAIAFKFAAESEYTILNSITWQVGRVGQITPVAELEPVQVGGVTISRATLHNFRQIEAKGLMIGDTVVVARAGDVIPEVVSRVVVEGAKLEPIGKPIVCPICSTPIFETPTGLIFCQNDNCASRISQRVIHFASKDGMDIQGLGPSIATYLCEAGAIENLEDIYLLDVEHPRRKILKSLGEGTADNLIKAIKDSKKAKLTAFLYALGIPSVGRGTSQRLVAQFKTLDAIRAASYNELVSVKDIGAKTANDILEFFVEEKVTVDRMLSLGVTFEEAPNGGKFDGLSFCFTGTLSKPRKQFETLVTDNGGKIASIGKSLSYLVAGESAGSKLDDANRLGVKVITEQELEVLLDS